MINPGFQPPNKFTLGNTGSKTGPKTGNTGNAGNTENKDVPGDFPVKPQQGNNKPSNPPTQDGPIPTGGLDPKTQFLATQGLNNKNQDSLPAEDVPENEVTPETNELPTETQDQIKELADGNPELENLLNEFAAQNPEAFENANNTELEPEALDPELENQINDLAGENPALTNMLKNLANQNPDIFQQLMALLESMLEKPVTGNPPQDAPVTPAGQFRGPVNTGNTGNAGGGGNAGSSNPPIQTGGSSNAGGVPDSEDENGLTAEQLNTAGPAAPVSQEEILRAANGDQGIADLLTRMDQDPEGHKALRLAIDKGTTYKRGELEGNVVGLTEYGGGNGPVITLENMTIDTAAHETAHAAYQDMSHAEVYRFGQRVSENLGEAA